MNKIYKCDSCNNVYSHRQSLWRHKQNCNNKRIRVVEQPIKKWENACSVPYEPETVKRTDDKQQKYGAGKVHNQQYNKTLIDSIVDGEHLQKKKKKTLSMNELFPPRDDLTPKVDVDDDITDTCLLYTSPSPRDRTRSRMPSSA